MRISNPDAEATPVGATRTMTMRLRRLSPDRHDLVDAAFLVGMLLFAFFGFVSTFDSWFFLVPVSIGVGFGLLIAHLSLTWKWPWPISLLCCLSAYFLFGGAIGFFDQTWHGLPTPTSLTELARLLASGWKAMLTTLPPLATNGPYITLVVLLAMVFASAGHLVSRRTRRVSLPLLVPIAALGATITLGTLAAPLLGVVGVGFAAVAFGWLANRFPRRRKVIGVNRVRALPAVLGAVTLVVALAGGFFLGPMLPGVNSSQRFVARTYVAPPIDLRDYPSPLVGFRKYSSKQLGVYYDKALVKVTGAEPGSWLRFSVLDSYNGHVWSAAGDPNDSSNGFVRLGSMVPNPPLGLAYEAQVKILDGYASNTDLNPWIPGFGRTTRVRFSGATAKAHAESLRFNLGSDQGIVPERLSSGDVVTLTTGSLARFDRLGDDTVPAAGKVISDSETDFMAPLAQKLGGQSAQPFQRVKQAAEKLRGGAWSDGTVDGQQSFLPGHSRFRLKQFLTATEFVGSDEQYSAVFALLASRYGFPARVVLGAPVPESGEIKGSDVKAWVELQVNDGSWVTVPTDYFTPDRSKQPNEAPKEADQQEAATNVPPPNPARPPGTFGEMLDTEPASNRIIPPERTLSEQVLAWAFYIGIPVGVVILILCGIVLAKVLRARRRRTRGELWARIAAGWQDLMDLARDAGNRLPGGATRLEQSAQLGGGRLTRLAENADAAVFGGYELTEYQVETYWGEAKQARSAMIATWPWWRRITARISLRSFFGAGRREKKAKTTGVGAERVLVRAGRTKR